MSEKFTVSVRGKASSEPIDIFLNRFYRKYFPNISSVFGFAEQCSLYGGRGFIEPQLNDQDIQWLYDHNIGFRIPLTNTRITLEDYKNARPFLEKYHKKGNSVIIFKDDFASWLREDFPEFAIEASAIKNLDTLPKIEKALKIYDTAVLPMQANDNLDLLKSIPDKSRITLFINGGCFYTCPARVCFDYVSKLNRKELPNGPSCSKQTHSRNEKGRVRFDLEQFKSLGYSSFKVLALGQNTTSKN